MVSDLVTDTTDEKTTVSSCAPITSEGIESNYSSTASFTPNPILAVTFLWLNDTTNTTMDLPAFVNDSFPAELKFNENSLTVVIVYCVLFVIAAVGNLTVFITLFKSRHRKSRISLMITHLAVADLMVTFIMIPLEVSYEL